MLKGYAILNLILGEGEGTYVGLAKSLTHPRICTPPACPRTEHGQGEFPKRERNRAGRASVAAMT
eukprot:358391-Chlamydomonas_euryale.AAC.6